MLIISEPGLYNLSKRSNKPGPKRFWRWITHEVLPSLRKTGGFGGSSSYADRQLLVDLFDRMDKLALEREDRALQREDRTISLLKEMHDDARGGETHG
jgi:anti-repressor protein